MAAVGPVTSEQIAQQEFADDYESTKYGTALDFGHDYSLTRINRKPMERASNINNNNVWVKSPRKEFTPDGILPISSTQELRCCDFIDFATPRRHASNSDTEWSEKDVTAENFELQKSRPEELTESTPPKNTCERSTSATYNLAKESENATVDMNMVENMVDMDVPAGTQYEPLSLRERISNIDLSIEWIKCELTLMRAQDLSLKQQFEQLFKEVMEFKLRIEMEKDEEEQFIEEDMSFEAE